MARPLRIIYPDAFYHITSRGNERKDIFKNKRDRDRFLSYRESATERYGAIIHVYCLMSNHYHLLMETPFGNLSQIMRHINGAYTTYFNLKGDRAVESVLGEDQVLSRRVKLYLCQRYSGKGLKEIGDWFGIGESGVSQASRRVRAQIRMDKTIGKRLRELEKALGLSRV